MTSTETILLIDLKGCQFLHRLDYSLKNVTAEEYFYCVKAMISK